MPFYLRYNITCEIAEVDSLQEEARRDHGDLNQVLVETEETTRAFDDALEFFLSRDFAAAHAAFAKVCLDAPQRADARYMGGMALWYLGDAPGACERLAEAIRIQPTEWLFHYGLGNVRVATDPISALEHYKNAIRLNPSHSELWDALFTKSLRSQSDAEIVSLARELSDGELACSTTILYLGKALINQGQYIEAEKALRAGLGHYPNDHRLTHRLALTLEYLRRHGEAADLLEEAVAGAPSNIDYHVDLGSNRLVRGRYKEAWPELEWRLKRPQYVLPERFGVDRCTDLRGVDSLLIMTEQGRGDIIQFSRYVPRIAQKVRCVCEVQGDLVELFKALDGDHIVIQRGADRPRVDAVCSVLSLPYMLGEGFDDPDGEPYLTINTHRVARWRRKFEGIDLPRVGVAWSGNPQYGLDWARSIPTETFKSVVAVPDVCFVSLQKFHQREGSGAIDDRLDLHDWTEELTDYAETAALIANLDLVISVDTSVAHLAGAMGKPVWLFNRALAPHWVWMAEGKSAPWYKSVRQFDQIHVRDWEVPVRRVCEQLTLAVSDGTLRRATTERRATTDVPAE